jgi:hypothetical protein
VSKWCKGYLMIPSWLDKRSWESLVMDCTKKWFKWVKMVTRILEDPHWFRLSGLGDYERLWM